jgi:hypothetical protein
MMTVRFMYLSLNISCKLPAGKASSFVRVFSNVIFKMFDKLFISLSIYRYSKLVIKEFLENLLRPLEPIGSDPLDRSMKHIKEYMLVHKLVLKLSLLFIRISQSIFSSDIMAHEPILLGLS